MNKFTAIYIRVSSEAQKQAGQILAMKKWADAQDGDIRWFSDKFTGRTMDRPGWKELENEIANGNVWRVAVWKIDRIGRTLQKMVNLLEDLKQRNVRLVSVTESIDFSTPVGRIMFAVLAGAAEMDNEQRRERINAGLAARRAKGLPMGGAASGERKRLENNLSKSQLALASKMWHDNVPISAIGRAVGVSRMGVHRLSKRLGWDRSRVKHKDGLETGRTERHEGNRRQREENYQKLLNDPDAGAIIAQHGLGEREV